MLVCMADKKGCKSIGEHASSTVEIAKQMVIVAERDWYRCNFPSEEKTPWKKMARVYFPRQQNIAALVITEGIYIRRRLEGSFLKSADDVFHWSDIAGVRTKMWSCYVDFIRICQQLICIDWTHDTPIEIVSKCRAVICGVCSATSIIHHWIDLQHSSTTKKNERIATTKIHH